MTRTAESVVIVGAAALAALGVTLVNLAFGAGLDVQVALSFLVVLIAFGAVHLALRQWAPRASTLLLPLAATITAIGFAEVYRLDPELAGKQRWWLLIASLTAVGVVFLLRNGLDPLRRYRWLFLAATILLLLAPLLPETWILRGVEVNGSRLWVRFDPGFTEINFQPGEIAKVLLVVFLASYLADRRGSLASSTREIGPIRVAGLRNLLPVAIAWVLAMAVLIYQRDLGASLLLFAVFVTLLYAATGLKGYLIGGALLFVAGAVTAWTIFDHVQRRVTAWVRPFDDLFDAGYQTAQSLFALGSGSISGSGLGLGRPDLIPSSATDFVFAAVGEELGLAGAIAVLCLFTLLIAVGFGIALRSRDLFRKLLAAGLTLVLGIQVILIIGGVTRMLPLTGLTLPFRSYGGSSLVSNFVLLVLLALISHEEAV